MSQKDVALMFDFSEGKIPSNPPGKYQDVRRKSKSKESSLQRAYQNQHQRDFPKFVSCCATKLNSHFKLKASVVVAILAATTAKMMAL